MKPLMFMLFTAVSLMAAPPEVEYPKEIRPGQLARVVIKSDKVVGTVKSFKDDEAFFEELAKKPGQQRYVFQADLPGTYIIAYWFQGELEGTLCTITVKKPGEKPVDPPAKPIGDANYFLIIRPDGPASPEFTKILELPAWQTLKDQGYRFKLKTQAQALADIGVKPPAGAKIPCIIALSINLEETESRVVNDNIAFPTTEEGILKLREIK